MWALRKGGPEVTEEKTWQMWGQYHNVGAHQFFSWGHLLCPDHSISGIVIPGVTFYVPDHSTSGIVIFHFYSWGCYCSPFLLAQILVNCHVLTARDWGRKVWRGWRNVPEWLLIWEIPTGNLARGAGGVGALPIATLLRCWG